MQDFRIWFSTGMEHILDWNGYDHILYITALCAMFTFSDWKKLLILITAFTIGHSLTLLASVSNFISVNQNYIELLIPLTIIITCLINIKYRNYLNSNNQHASINYKLNYLLALCFGFIHGLGFSYLLKSMLGKEESIVLPLLSFNIGLEAGQLIIVGFLLLISIILTRFSRIKKSDWVMFISSATFGISTLLFLQRINAL